MASNNLHETINIDVAYAPLDTRYLEIFEREFVYSYDLKVTNDIENQKQYFADVVSELGIYFEIDGRIKTFRKMCMKLYESLTKNEKPVIRDLIGIRIIVDSDEERFLVKEKLKKVISLPTDSESFCYKDLVVDQVSNYEVNKAGHKAIHIKCASNIANGFSVWTEIQIMTAEEACITKETHDEHDESSYGYLNDISWDKHISKIYEMIGSYNDKVPVMIDEDGNFDEQIASQKILRFK